MGHYRLTPNAKDDLNHLWQYGLETYGETKADEYYYRFIERFRLLAEQPLLYPAVDHIRLGYRRSVCDKQSIYYRIASDENNIEIIRIIGQQDIHVSLS